MRESRPRRQEPARRIRAGIKISTRSMIDAQADRHGPPEGGAQGGIREIGRKAGRAQKRSGRGPRRRWQRGLRTGRTNKRTPGDTNGSGTRGARSQGTAVRCKIIARAAARAVRIFVAAPPVAVSSSRRRKRQATRDNKDREAHLSAILDAFQAATSGSELRDARLRTDLQKATDLSPNDTSKPHKQRKRALELASQSRQLGRRILENIEDIATGINQTHRIVGY